jgi:hypothetical protein
MPTISSIAKPTSVTDAITAIAKSVVDAVAWSVKAEHWWVG